MGLLKSLLSILFFLFVILILTMYWFVPYREIYLETVPEYYQGVSNFSVDGIGNQEMQFYPNMRYPDSRISYKIYDCSLKKRNDVERAFEIIEEKTILDFYPVNQDERIGVYCSEEKKVSENFFIAGEGGPTEIIKTDKFNVILGGEILLFEESKCVEPNIAIHELFHAFGFNHSDNPNNIMYHITKCSQTISEDLIKTINQLYSFPSYPDLELKEISAKIKGRYLDTNFTIVNNGLTKSNPAKIIISTDNEIIKEIPLESIEIGHGKTLYWKNLWIQERDFDNIIYELKTTEKELDKKNNIIKLEIK